MKKFFYLLAFLFIAFGANAQQLPMFTKYMFVPMSFNPAYTGSAQALDLSILHRQQWVGIDGAPMTQVLNLSSPIKEKNIGVGLNMSFDQIGVSQTFNVYGSFAYHIPFGKTRNKKKKFDAGNLGFVSFGLQGGVTNFSANYNELTLEQLNDPAFQVEQPNLWLPNFGAGVYVYTKQWYAGFSSPMLINNSMRSLQPGEAANTLRASQYRHMYLMGGGIIPLSDVVDLKPSFLVKTVGFTNKKEGVAFGAPTEFNIDISFLFNKSFWVGSSFRSAVGVFTGDSSYDSVDFWAGYRFKNGLRFGVAYDFSLTEIQGPSVGSYELMVGYDMLRNVDNVPSVRYF